MKIIYTTSFLKAYKKLPRDIKIMAEKGEKIFRENPFHPSLKTHKLKGRLREFWSLSIGFKYRIIFEFADDDLVYFHLVGNHSIYQ